MRLPGAIEECVAIRVREVASVEESAAVARSVDAATADAPACAARLAAAAEALYAGDAAVAAALAAEGASLEDLAEAVGIEVHPGALHRRFASSAAVLYSGG